MAGIRKRRSAAFKAKAPWRVDAVARFGRIDPKHSGSVFAARCTLYACRPRLLNGYLTQMAPGDTTVGTTPS
jgi:hypothetical protein